MSCPDWKRLAAHRLTGTDEPEGWNAALAHFDGGCPTCRRNALAADPTLIFRWVPTVEIEPAQESGEVESMIQAVAAMRTASRAQALETRGSRQSWWRWSAAAALAVAALSLGSDDRFHGARSIQETLPFALETGADLIGGAMPAALAEEGPAPVTPAPVVEDLGRRGEQVYQMYSGKDLSVVAYINENLGDV
jgi:hypothetical protein